MPVTDIRVDVGFFDHPKTIKLHGMVGDAGIIALLRLWGFTATYHPKGALTGMTAEAVTIAARWTGRADFVRALIECGMLDVVDTDGNTTYAIHDWTVHQRFAFFFPERQAQARKNIAKRWKGKRKKPKRGKASRADTDGNTDGNTDGITKRNTPTPTPSPEGGGGSAAPSAPPDGGGRLPPLVVAQPPMTKEEKQRNREEVRRLRESLEGGHA